MLFIKNKNLFLVRKETLKDYVQLQEIRFQNDIENHMTYSVEFIHRLVHQYKFQHRLDNYQSVGHKNLLFQYHTFQPLTILQAAMLHKDDHLASLEKYVNQYEFVAVNENGGFCPYTPEDTDEIVQYEYISDYIYDNNTLNLVIENSAVIDNELLEIIDSNIEPSHIVHYKHIAREKKVDEFIRSRKDWTLWIYTQGMDNDLYINFLNAYQDYIEDIMVKTSKTGLVEKLSEAYPKITFRLLGEEV